MSDCPPLTARRPENSPTEKAAQQKKGEPYGNTRALASIFRAAWLDRREPVLAGF
jgi:hypothetical protein